MFLLFIIFALLHVGLTSTTFNCTAIDDPWMQFPGLCRIFEANFNASDDVTFEPGIKNLNEEFEIIFMRSKPTFIPVQVFTKVPKLIALEAQFCEIAELPSLTAATELRKLDLKENYIEQIRANAFNGASNLRTIDLFRNHILHVHPEAFYWLPELVHVLLGSNRIRNIDRNLFSRQTKLQSIDLTDNFLTGRFDLQFYAIRKLDISFNAIRNVTLEAADETSNDVECEILAAENEIKWLQVSGDLTIESLNLRGNQLRTMESIQVSRPQKLVNLDISSNPFALISRQDLEVFNQLERLNMANTTRPHRNIFDNLTNLTSLNLGYNGLSTFELKLVESLRKLEILNLDGNALTSLGLDGISEKLKPFVVSLFNNRFQCSTLREIEVRLEGVGGSVARQGDVIDNQISGYNGIECHE